MRGEHKKKVSRRQGTKKNVDLTNVVPSNPEPVDEGGKRVIDAALQEFYIGEGGEAITTLPTFSRKQCEICKNNLGIDTYVPDVMLPLHCALKHRGIEDKADFNKKQRQS